MSGRELGINLSVPGYETRAGEELHAFFNSVGPGYFNTMQIPLLRGRDFDAHDSANSPRVAVINQAMAAHFFGNSDPVGKHVRFVEGNRELEIVGVVANAKYNDIREATPDFLYLDFNQLAFNPLAPTQIRSSLLLRTSGSPSSLLSGSLRRLVRTIESSIQVTRIETMRQDIDESIHQDRFLTGLCTAFSALALLLTCIGLFGTLSFTVASRRSELGVRMALGAVARDIFSLVMGQALRVTAIGLLIGIAGSLVLSVYLKSLLFEISATDPLAYAGVALLLLCAAALAAYVPARRAMSVDPVESLRYE
jgi:predicted permease